ncbi:hypothetical protein BT96DRAFT_1003851 [Gymnopus androsaceus JB14]|uniref:Uncharacterized protein n=1 Tax=Gymnopus androsaceus JB14 TaxID=1447944 RepID=A0A6A4GSQ5_9AGAR|nr:hypothetical protein BT96DRAFT_1003851 [Gymnopus androsaceus JB14]
MREEEISQEWNKLSVDEQNKWEKHAAAECDVQHNRECFVSSLLKLLQGCLQFGHIGHGEIATVVVFDEGFDTEGRKIGSHGIFASSDMKFSTGQKDKLQRLLPEYKSYGSKRKQAFDAMYSKHLMSDASFATPAGITAEEWKRTLLKWFDNNGKKSGQTVKTDVDAQSKDVSTAGEYTRSEPCSASCHPIDQSVDHYVLAQTSRSGQVL